MTKMLSNWGRYPVVESEEFISPSAAALRSILCGTQQSFIPRGNGRCYGDASLASNIISSLALDHILAFDRDFGIFECEAGVILDQVLNVIVPEGWFLPVTPGTKFITVGGAVASDIHGKNHHVDGSFCDHVIEIELMLSSGEVIVCSPEENNDLFEATRGGMGLTGFILRVKFRLKKIKTSFIRQVQVKASNLSELMEFFQEYSSYTYTMSWIDCLKGGRNFGRGILMAGEHATPDELSTKQHRDIHKLYSDTLFTFPVDLPSFILNQYSVKAFNYLYFHKNAGKYIRNVIPYAPFFYPLDKILEWNKGYGKTGFLQYQFVLPMESSAEGMKEILNRISCARMGSFLAVFKVFGRKKGLISFPMEGCTLALDFPIRRGLLSFLDELDRVVLDYGGRLYLTKDARMKSETFWRGYPEAKRFVEIIQKYNPGYRFRSRQSDRLEITQ